jgi:hypothetical protein
LLDSLLAEPPEPTSRLPPPFEGERSASPSAAANGSTGGFLAPLASAAKACIDRAAAAVARIDLLKPLLSKLNAVIDSLLEP